MIIRLVRVVWEGIIRVIKVIRVVKVTSVRVLRVIGVIILITSKLIFMLAGPSEYEM